MTVLQLNPPIPFDTVEGEHCLALLLLDYGVDYECMFLCAMEQSRELWCLKQSKLRAVENATVGRVSEENTAGNKCKSCQRPCASDVVRCEECYKRLCETGL